ncbi:MAG: hypothetical protein LBQ03_03170 [Puniceicoccales bacterium]|jgi:hypothetical protein|nr:hypothetical protein [Puniceicoccales bacterium]
MSITNDRFSDFTSAFDAIADIRNHARKGASDSQPITVNGKTYDIKAETSIKHRDKQGIRNALRKLFHVKETTVTIAERQTGRQLGQDPFSGQMTQLPSATEASTTGTIFRKFAFDKGKGLRTELQKLDEKFGLKPESTTPTPNASQSEMQRQIAQAAMERRNAQKAKEVSQTSKATTSAPVQAPQGTQKSAETIMNELASAIPSFKEMQDLRTGKVGTDQFKSIDALEQSILKSLQSGKVPENLDDLKQQISTIRNQKYEILQKAKETLEQLRNNALSEEQRTGMDSSGTKTIYESDRLVKILEPNVNFNEPLVMIECLRAKHLLATIETIQQNPNMSPSNLKNMMETNQKMENALSQSLLESDGQLENLGITGDPAKYQRLLSDIRENIK